jgi:hypothetical protein
VEFDALPHPLTSMWRYKSVSIYQNVRILDEFTNLEGVLAREALVAVIARERFHSQMDPFMSLQVMISVEALWTLIAFERSIVCGLLLMRRMS